MARILIADDSASLLEILGHVLKLKGHEVHIADCRHKLFTQLYHLCPDLIFMDVRLNNEDGRELCLIIQEGPYKNVPIVLMSATPQFLEGYNDYKACAALEKPFDIREILELVTKCLQRDLVA